MSSPRFRFTNEQLLHANPLYLERSTTAESDECGRIWYDVKLHTGNLKIGHARIIFRNNNTKELYFPTIIDKFRRRGLGVALYVAAADVSNNLGVSSALHSAQRPHLTPAARRVWSSLVRRRLAEEPSWDNGRYHYVGLPLPSLEHVVDEAYDSVVRSGDFDSAEL